MSTSPYRRRISWLFDAGGDTWEVTRVMPGYVEIEETRKNGQEDTHIRGAVVFMGDQWRADDGLAEMIDIYGCGQPSVDAIEAFFAEHGPPLPEDDQALHVRNLVIDIAAVSTVDSPPISSAPTVDSTRVYVGTDLASDASKTAVALVSRVEGKVIVHAIGHDIPTEKVGEWIASALEEAHQASETEAAP